ncbi:MAG TPA: beta-L-arabinofuranosidase domain-containing protein [Terracidiphilus sp.]|nr:beta-L-arabinofuranosidase domain-containing protein [Terracidiphilus sp.]
MNNFSRRNFLKTGATAAGLFLIGPSSVIEASEPEVKAAYPADKLVSYPLSSVRLGPGIFKQQEEINARYLDTLTVDRLLHSFRITAGLSSSATPYGGWEDPDCELRGHFAGGHFLSAVALATASTQNSDLERKGHELVSGLAQCQKKMGSGFLSAFPEVLFEYLVEGIPVWAPFYTCHKIMAGLLDMYSHTGNTEALDVVEGMARWVGDFFWPISTEQRMRMLRTEYGGMNEVLANLAAATGKERYLHTARLFEQPSFLDPLADRRDTLQGLHANTHVPKIIGSARMYEVTGDHRYRHIAAYFLGEVLAARSYAIGNTSVGEHWTTPADHLEGTLAWSNAECCVAYNLMKLERHVFGWSADARWMDEYERSLFNCRLGTQNGQGLKQYFFPLAAGYWRAYNSPEQSFWCCTGTGAEEFAKFADTIYFHRGGDIYVNQYIASTLNWKDEGISLEQTTQFPHEQGTTLKIKSSCPALRTIHLRIPQWAGEGAQAKINGRPLDAMASPGSYLSLRKVWQDGDTISLSLPMRLRHEALLGDESVAALLYGPLVLAADLGAGPPDGPERVIHGRPTEPAKIPPAAALPAAAGAYNADASQWVQVESASDLRFSASGQDKKYDLAPMYQIGDQRYSVYWQMKKAAKQG